VDAVDGTVEEGVGQAGGVPVRGVQDADQDHGTQLQQRPISQSGCWEKQENDGTKRIASRDIFALQILNQYMQCVRWGWRFLLPSFRKNPKYKFLSC
jgi:hypothetical protein